ncbi:Transposase IS66 family protein [compost metagenome]
MTDYYAGYNALGAQTGVERLGCWAHARRKFFEAQKVQPKGNLPSADSTRRIATQGKRAAAIMSLIQSARLNGHDPYAYLKDILMRLPTQRVSEIDQVPPHKLQPV